jgi:hypothetical protein
VKQVLACNLELEEYPTAMNPRSEQICTKLKLQGILIQNNGHACGLVKYIKHSSNHTHPVFVVDSEPPLLPRKLTSSLPTRWKKLN